MSRMHDGPDVDGRSDSHGKWEKELGTMVRGCGQRGSPITPPPPLPLFDKRNFFQTREIREFGFDYLFPRSRLLSGTYESLARLISWLLGHLSLCREKKKLNLVSRG